MNAMNIRNERVIAAALLLGLIGLAAMFGCAGTQGAAKPGALLWGENCGSCHNIRTPASQTDEHWEVVGMHMRARANLTSEEAGKIVEFLQMSN